MTCTMLRPPACSLAPLQLHGAGQLTLCGLNRSAFFFPQVEAAVIGIALPEPCYSLVKQVDTDILAMAQRASYRGGSTALVKLVFCLNPSLCSHAS